MSGCGEKRLVVAAMVVLVLGAISWYLVDLLAFSSTNHGASEGNLGSSDVTQQVSAVELSDPATPVALAVPEDAAWWRIDDVGAVPHNLIPPRPEGSTDAVLVKLAAELRHLHEDSVVTIALPQTGESYRLAIERVETLIGASRSYTARTRIGPRVSLVLTMAPQSTFGWVSTGNGAFELMGNARLAWLAPEAGLREEFANGLTDEVGYESVP